VIPDSEGYGNQFLRYSLGLDVPEAKGLAAHRALADCWVTAALLRYLLPLAPAMSLPELVEWSERPILQKVCGFGKHKGTPWPEVPRSYLSWMVSPGGMTDLDGDLLHTVRHYLDQ
jgi:exodeoxyribonuclease X